VKWMAEWRGRHVDDVECWVLSSTLLVPSPSLLTHYRKVNGIYERRGPQDKFKRNFRIVSLNTTTTPSTAGSWTSAARKEICWQLEYTALRRFKFVAII
jgi:hypothetical protein